MQYLLWTSLAILQTESSVHPVSGSASVVVCAWYRVYTHFHTCKPLVIQAHRKLLDWLLVFIQYKTIQKSMETCLLSAQNIKRYVNQWQFLFYWWFQNPFWIPWGPWWITINASLIKQQQIGVKFKWQSAMSLNWLQHAAEWFKFHKSSIYQVNMGPGHPAGVQG